MPSFSVIVATHQRAAPLQRALASLRAQLSAPLQVLVVSDSVDPESLRVFNAHARDTDVFVQRHGAPGPAASRNMALRLAMADHVVFLDDDDSFHPEFFSALSASMARFAPDEIAFTNFEILEYPSAAQQVPALVRPVDLGGIDPASVFVKNFIPNNCLAFPRLLLGGVEFAASLAYEDWDFLLSVCRKGRLRHVPIYGPCAHKTLSAEPGSERRGQKNNASLVECYLAIYQRHAAPTPLLAQQRRQLFASIGLDLDRMTQDAPDAP